MCFWCTRQSRAPKVKGQTVQPGEHGQTYKRTDGRTERQTDGRYQFYYLPALRSINIPSILGEISDGYESVDWNEGSGYENVADNAIYENDQQNDQPTAIQGSQVNAAFESGRGDPCQNTTNQTDEQYEQLDFSDDKSDARSNTFHCKIDRKVVVIILAVILLLIVVVIAVSVSFAMQNSGNDDSTSSNGWATWSSWGTCSVSASCGTGTQERLRLCTKSVNDGDDSQCPGSDRQIQNCTIHCPINGAWTEWSNSTCSVTCGKGTKRRTRTCTNPAPKYGGKMCSGPDTKTETCIEYPRNCSASVCFDPYTTFSESYRRESFRWLAPMADICNSHSLESDIGECDRDKVTEGEWYRFNLSTGENSVLDHNPNPYYYPDLYTCGTCWQIWMNSSHPTEYGVIKDVTMVVNNYYWGNNRGSGSVTKCVNGEVFYLYKLWVPWFCSASYCAGTYLFEED